ncbi:MAG: hypothetical protein ACRCTA_04420 [Bacilli bacterium]
MKLLDKIFNKKARDAKSYGLIDKYNEGLLSVDDFLGEFASIVVYYSTPFGESIEGEPRLFALEGHQNQVYLPVFTSSLKLQEYCKVSGRANYIIIQDTFYNFIKSTYEINVDSKSIIFGALIDYKEAGITLDASMFEKALVRMYNYQK